MHWNKLKRYTLAAVDHATQLGHARMCKNESSRSATDFHHRLRYLVNQPIEDSQTDNGSEFAREFERATAKLGIQRYSSRAKTPKDNPEIERFNETLEYEWLIEHDFNRPHQSLAYLAPVEHIEEGLAKTRSPVLPMWSATAQC